MLFSLIWNPPSVRPCFPWKHVLKPNSGEEYLTGYSVSYLSLISLPPIFSLFFMSKSLALFGFTLFIATWSVTLFPVFIYINSFKDFYLNVKWDPCSLTGNYNTDCGTDMINSNKCACPLQFCHTFHLYVPANFPVYQMLGMCPRSYIGLFCVLSVLVLFSASLDLCFILSVRAVLLFIP